MYTLYIANKNYSSWSLRPWVLMKMLGIPFEEKLAVFGEDFTRFSPTGKVPCLVDGRCTVWDSLSIVEYLAERHVGVWPSDADARAFARSAAAEMHSGFAELREVCSMSCGVRVQLHAYSESLTRDLTRLAALWEEGLMRFGGPFLAGSNFCAADAFFVPVALRAQTYNLELSERASAYAQLLLALPAVQDWYAEALAEPYREAQHEAWVLCRGTLLEDLRAPLEQG